MKHVGKTLMIAGSTVIIIGLGALLFNFLDFNSLPDNCLPDEYNCDILLANWRQDRTERLLLTGLGIAIFLLGWVEENRQKRKKSEI